MRSALLSDVHGRRVKLERLVADARSRAVDQFVSLGDTGNGDCLDLLQEIGAKTVFGNYEVSGWRHLPSKHRDWVRGWPPMLVEGQFLAVHAVPWRPEGVDTVVDHGSWLVNTGRSWRSLFPYMTENTDHLWQALAVLEEADKLILFHGHTHQQSAWEWRPKDRLTQVETSDLRLAPGHRYIVGVGSVGMPEDGFWSTYTIYDDQSGHIEFVQIDP